MARLPQPRRQPRLTRWEPYAGSGGHEATRVPTAPGAARSSTWTRDAGPQARCGSIKIFLQPRRGLKRWHSIRTKRGLFGYKNHLGVDKAHKLIRKWDATDAAVHESQKLDDVLDLSNTGKGVWADSAYRSVQIEAGLKAKGLQSRIPRRAARNRPLSERQKSANTTRSRVRACRARIRPPAELDGWQDRAHHRHRAGEV